MTTDEAVIARAREARMRQSAAATELWNARLALLHQAGDFRGMVDHLQRPIEEAGNNCTCNNACNLGCLAPVSGVATVL